MIAMAEFMNRDIFPFFGLHQLASRLGDGLRPELARLMERDAELAALGVVRLAPAGQRAAPVRQQATAEELRAAGVAVLPAAGAPGTADGGRVAPDRARGKA
ncbi:MAG: hypothetical protein AcusKO_44020 [Acuticoccus sp.]